VLAFLLDHTLDQRTHLVRAQRILRQEDEAGPVLGGGGEDDAELRALAPEEAVGDLQEDARAVAGVRLAAARAAVEQVDQHLQGLAHDAVRFPALDVDDKPDAARVVLVAGIVKPFRSVLTLEQRQLAQRVSSTDTIIGVSHDRHSGRRRLRRRRPAGGLGGGLAPPM